MVGILASWAEPKSILAKEAVLGYGLVDNSSVKMGWKRSEWTRVPNLIRKRVKRGPQQYYDLAVGCIGHRWHELLLWRTPRQVSKLWGEGYEFRSSHNGELQCLRHYLSGIDIMNVVLV